MSVRSILALGVVIFLGITIARSVPAGFSGRGGRIICVATSPDGKHLAAVGEDGAGVLRDLTSWKEMATLRGLPAGAVCAAISSDGETLAVACEDGTIHVLDVATGEGRATLRGHAEKIECLALSPDGKTLASGGMEDSIRLWDVASGEERGCLPARHRGVIRLAFSPDGRTLASAGFFCFAVTVWDMPAGRERVLDDPPGLVEGSADYVESLAFSPDGKTLASGSFQEMTLWDVEKAAPKTRIPGFADRVTAIAYSPDGKLIATGGGAATEDGEVKLFDANGKPAGDIKNGHSDTVFGLAFSPDNKLLATAAADKFIKVWEMPAGKLAKSFEGHTHHVMDVAWSIDGKKLFSGGADNLVKVWDYEKGEKLKDAPGHTKQVTRVWSIGGKKPEFLTAGGDASLRSWTVDGANGRTYPSAGSDFLYTVSASTDGGIVAAGGEDGVVRVYDGVKGTLIKAALPPGEQAPEGSDATKKIEPKKKKK